VTGTSGPVDQSRHRRDVSVADNGHLTSAAFRAACTEIVRALDAAQAKRNFDSSEARAAVEQCARSARAAGVLPEKLIIELKALMRDVALPEMRTWYRSVLTDRVIVWAIEAYYEIVEPPPADDTSGSSR
jgi:erythromycin esterase-like protein